MRPGVGCSLVNIPVGDLLGIVLAIRFLPEDRAEARPRDLDFAGFCLLSPGLVLFLYGVDHVSERIGLTAFFVAVVLLTVFIRTATPPGRATMRSLIFSCLGERIFQHRC